MACDLANAIADNTAPEGGLGSTRSGDFVSESAVMARGDSQDSSSHWDSSNAAPQYRVIKVL